MLKRTYCVAAVGVALLAVAGSAWAEIETIRIDRTEPLANGHAFGDVGSYILQIGVARGSLDPDDSRNAVIVNLHQAPRNARGRVEYEADIAGIRCRERLADAPGLHPDEWATEGYRNRDGRWLIVDHHSSAVPAPPK